MFEGMPYSMPPEATHIAGTMFLYEDKLRIVAGRFEVIHDRRKKGDPPAPLPEHRAAKIAAVHGKRAKLYEKRQQLLNLGADSLALLTEIVHRDAKRAAQRVEELYDLLERHGDEAMRKAITYAVAHHRLSVTGVRYGLTMSDRGRDAQGHHAAASQPRGQQPHQLALTLPRAESNRGAS